MKLNLSLLAAALLIPALTYGQDPIPVKTTGYYSFITDKPIMVYPFMGNTNDPKPSDVDRSISFTLRSGTKFFVLTPVNSGSTLSGYVVQVWNYKKNDEKKTFYSNYLKPKTDSEKTLDDKKKDLIAKDQALKFAKANVSKDSLELVSLQNKLKDAQDALRNSSKKLVSSSLNIDINRAFPTADPAVKSKEISNFKSAQEALKNKLSPDEPAPEQLKTKLVDASLKLPTLPNSILEQDRTEYVKAKSAVDETQSLVETKAAGLQDSKAALPQLNTDLQTARNSYIIAQSQDINSEVDAYKKTKEQIGRIAGTPDNPVSPYATFKDLAYIDQWANGWMFFVPINTFNSYCTAIYPSSEKFTWGFLTMPLKLRFDNKNKQTGLPAGHFGFEQNLNFGISFGGKHQFVSTNDISLNYLLGVSVVNVPLNNATDGNPATSAQAVSLSAGLMFQYDKFQIGTFLGKDFTGDHAKDFLYQGKTWLGIAIGVSLFGEGKTTADTGSQNQE